MSTSRKPALSGPSKKISSWVRPGVCEVRARALRPVSALTRLDLPTLERPAKATSMPAIGGSVSIEGEAQKNCQSPAHRFCPCSISFASMSGVMRSLSIPVIARSEATKQSGLSFQVLDCFASLAMTDPNPLSFSWLLPRLLRSKRRPEIVEQFDLHAVAMHDEALLQHRKRIVPGPVDHEAGREARQHEGEDQRHPGKDHLLGRVRRRRIELHLEPHRDAHDDRPNAEREIMP